MTEYNFRVVGKPAPQGSKKGFIRGGRVNLVESSKDVAPWRESVKHDAMQAVGTPMLEGPVMVDLTFYLSRPASAPKRITRPFKKPDLDKLVRSTLDGLTDAGMWVDDSQVVSLFASKHFAVMSPPGVDITIKPAGGHSESTQETS